MMRRTAPHDANGSGLLVRESNGARSAREPARFSKPLMLEVCSGQPVGVIFRPKLHIMLCHQGMSAEPLMCGRAADVQPLSGADS